jgi:hypothetical protein
MSSRRFASIAFSSSSNESVNFWMPSFSSVAVTSSYSTPGSPFHPVGAENSVSPGNQPIWGKAVTVLTPPRRRLVPPPRVGQTKPERVFRDCDFGGRGRRIHVVVAFLAQTFQYLGYLHFGVEREGKPAAALPQGSPLLLDYLRANAADLLEPSPVEIRMLALPPIARASSLRSKSMASPTERGLAPPIPSRVVHTPRAICIACSLLTCVSPSPLKSPLTYPPRSHRSSPRPSRKDLNDVGRRSGWLAQGRLPSKPRLRAL